MIGVRRRFYQASQLGDVRRDAAAAERGHAVLPALALRRGEGLLVLDDPQLPRGLRHVRGQRHPVQPRVAAARRDLRDAQDRAGGGPRSRRVSRSTCTWATSTRSATGATPRSTSRRCGGCCSPTSPTTTCSPPARPTRCATSCSSLRARRARLGEARPVRRALPAPHRGRRLIGDASKAEEILGWKPRR